MDINKRLEELTIEKTLELRDKYTCVYNINFKPDVRLNGSNLETKITCELLLSNPIKGTHDKYGQTITFVKKSIDESIEITENELNDGINSVIEILENRHIKEKQVELDKDVMADTYFNFGSIGDFSSFIKKYMSYSHSLTKFGNRHDFYKDGGFTATIYDERISISKNGTRFFSNSNEFGLSGEKDKIDMYKEEFKRWCHYHLISTDLNNTNNKVDKKRVKI